MQFVEFTEELNDNVNRFKQSSFAINTAIKSMVTFIQLREKHKENSEINEEAERAAKEKNATSRIKKDQVTFCRTICPAILYNC